MTDLYRWLQDRLSAERGQTMAEYAVVLAVITVVIVGALSLLAGGIERRRPQSRAPP